MTPNIEFFTSCVSNIVNLLKSFEFELFGFNTNIFNLALTLIILTIVITLLKRFFGIRDIYDASIAGTTYVMEGKKEKKSGTNKDKSISELRNEVRKSRGK